MSVLVCPCLSSSLLPSSFVVSLSSCTQRRQFLSKVLVHYCFLEFRRIGEYISLICSILSSALLSSLHVTATAIQKWRSILRRRRKAAQVEGLKKKKRSTYTMGSPCGMHLSVYNYTYRVAPQTVQPGNKNLKLTAHVRLEPLLLVIISKTSCTLCYTFNDRLVFTFC